MGFGYFPGTDVTIGNGSGPVTITLGGDLKITRYRSNAAVTASIYSLGSEVTLDLGAANRTIAVVDADSGLGTGTTTNSQLTVNGDVLLGSRQLIQGAGVVTLNGVVSGTGAIRFGNAFAAASLTLKNANNSFNGGISTGGFGTLIADGTTAIADTGTNSVLGSGGTISLNNNSLNLTGFSGPQTSNRAFVIGNTNGRINNNGTSSVTLTGNFTNDVTDSPMTLGGTFNTGTNEISGLIANGTKTMGLTNAASAWKVSNDSNSFSRGVSVGGGTLSFTSIADVGTISALGTGNTDATITINNASLTYVGSTAAASNRPFNVGNPSARINNNGSNPLTLTGTIANNIADGTLSLAGSYVAGVNEITGLISDGTKTLGIGNNTSSWRLSNNSNTFSRGVNVTGGTLSFTSVADTGVASALGTANLAGSGISVNNGGVSFIGSTASSSNRPIGFNSSGGASNSTFIAANGATTAAALSLSGVFSNTDTGNNTVIRNFNLQGANTGLNTLSSVIRDSIIAGAVTTVNKREAGTWIVSGTNTYSGTTNVFGGTLFINGNHSAVTSLTTVNSGGKLGGMGTLGGSLQVNNGGGLAVVVNGTNPVKLTVNGDVNLDNTSTLSVATQGAGFNQTSYAILEYTGTLTGELVPQGGYLIEHNETLKQLILTVDPNFTTPYQLWIGSFFPDSTDPNVIGETADPDFDGLENALEYVLGTLPNKGTQTSLPESQKVGANLVFTFDQVVEAINAGFVPTVEYSTSLATGSWSTATAGMTSTVNEGAIDAVTVTIPIPGGATKLFARLKVTTP